MIFLVVCCYIGCFVGGVGGEVLVDVCFNGCCKLSDDILICSLLVVLVGVCFWIGWWFCDFYLWFVILMLGIF